MYLQLLQDARTKPQISKSRAKPSTANQNLEPHSTYTEDEINKLFNMIERDYRSSPRRRGPINNAIPSQARFDTNS